MEILLNVENHWDGEVDSGDGTLLSHFARRCYSRYKGIKNWKAPGPTGVESEMMNASGGFDKMWMTDLINNIVKEGCIPDDWRKSILVHVFKGKCDPIVCSS